MLLASQDSVHDFETGSAACFYYVHARAAPAIAATLVLDAHRDFTLGILSDRGTVQLEVTQRQLDARDFLEGVEGGRDWPVAMRALGFLGAIFVEEGYGCRRRSILLAQPPGRWSHPRAGSG